MLDSRGRSTPGGPDGDHDVRRRDPLGCRCSMAEQVAVMTADEYLATALAEVAW